MLALPDALALSVSYFPPRRIGEALRIFYPCAADGPERLASWNGRESVPNAAPDVALVFEYLAGVADGAYALARARQLAGVVEESAARQGLTAVGWSGPDYPLLLAAIPDPPPVLWVAGRVACLSEPLIAMVGARRASPYGLDCATMLACALVGHGFGVVSGLARGVDGASHRGALKAGGTTVAVLGCGADVVYPPEHAALAHQVRAAGAVVSEFPPGSPPRAANFPRRNRIISGLASAVIVIEASEKSGSLITADAALEQGREVMAVPGNVLNGRNRGGNGLIKDGAALVEDVDDVLAALRRWAAIVPRRAASRTAREEDALLAAMVEGEPYDVDRLSADSGLAPGVLLSRLLALELAGSVRREAGGRFVRVGGSC